MKSKTSVERLIARLGLQTEEGKQLWGVGEVSALIHGRGVLTLCRCRYLGRRIS